MSFLLCSPPPSPAWSGSLSLPLSHLVLLFLHLSSFVSPLPGSLSALCSASYFSSPVDRSRCPSFYPLATFLSIPFSPLVFDFRSSPFAFPFAPSSLHSLLRRCQRVTTRHLLCRFSYTRHDGLASFPIRTHSRPRLDPTKSTQNSKPRGFRDREKGGVCRDAQGGGEELLRATVDGSSAARPLSHDGRRHSPLFA